MSKTFTCKELMGPCDAKFYSDTLAEIVQQGMPHMQSDDTHKAHFANMGENHTQQDYEKWFEETQKVFDAKPDDE